MKSHQQFFAEMKRRRVFRVMAAYGIIGFGIIEAAEAIFPRVALPDWAVTLVVWLTLLGLPIAVLLAWAFDSTPEGVRRTEDATPEEISAIIAQPASKRWTAGLLALGGVVLLFGGWWMGRQAARPEVNLDVTDAGEHEEVRRLVMLAAYDGDWDEASRLTKQEARQEFPFFELGRLLRRGWVESLRGTDTKAVGDSILRLDFESTAGGIGDLADFAAYIYKNDVENAWGFLEEAEGNARAAGELVVLEIALNFATQTKARLGRTEEALEALEGMIDQPGLRPKLADLLHDPTWDALRGEPRFDDIIERRRAFEEQAAREAEADRPWLP